METSNRTSDLTRVDEDGVPTLVQLLESVSGTLVRARYFDGTTSIVLVPFERPIRPPHPTYIPEPSDFRRLGDYHRHLGWWWALAEERADQAWVDRH